MHTVTVYACPSVPMDSIECTIEYDPAVGRSLSASAQQRTGAGRRWLVR